MSSSAAKTLVLVVAVAVPAYWYWSPYVAMRSMQVAAKKLDADAFNSHVDYPKLRDSLKQQFSARMGGQLSDAGRGGSDAERAGASLGTMLGMAFTDRLIDVMVQPEYVMRAMDDGKLQVIDAAKQQDASATKPPKVRWDAERTGVDRVVVYHADSKQKPADKRAGFVFDRSGFATWKLTEIRLPMKE
jgi:hypothetical protein